MYELTLERDFKMPVERLFKAWKDPEKLKQWFAPGALVCSEADVEFCEGGDYRIRMDGDEEPHIVVGKYVEIKENELIKFSWRWHTKELVTTVLVEFKSLSEKTSSLKLTHSEFPEEELKNNHNGGWTGILEKLGTKTDI